MNPLFTLFIILGVHNPFIQAPMPSFYIAPPAAVVVISGAAKHYQPAPMHRYTPKPIQAPAQTPEPYYPKAASQPTGCPYGDQIPVDSAKCIPPGGWDATNAPGFGVTCFATTQCLNQAFGTPANDPSQGLIFTCPDGAPSQGSCQTPGGDK